MSVVKVLDSAARLLGVIAKFIPGTKTRKRSLEEKRRQHQDQAAGAARNRASRMTERAEKKRRDKL